jgi:hypothetical protein
MPRSKILSASLVVLSVSAVVNLNASVAESGADDCRGKPGAAGPRGTHWHYRVNRSDQRHCWFLTYERLKVHSRTHAAASVRASPIPAAEHDGFAEAAAATATPIRPPSVQTISVPASAASEPADAVTATARPSVAEDEAGALFSARWPNSSKFWDFEERVFTAVPNSYAERYSAANTDDQMPLVWPVAEVTRPQTALDVVCESASRSSLQIAALLVALLAIAFGAFKLAFGFRQSHPVDPPPMPDEPPVQRHFDKASVNRNSTPNVRQDRHSLRPITPTDPASDLKKSLAELMADLRRARASLYSPRSFAPRTLGAIQQKSRTASDLLPPIDGWGEARAAAVAAPVEKAPTWSALSRRAHVLSDLPETTLPAGPSLVPA